VLGETFRFRLLLEGPELDSARVERFLEAGCDDAVFSERQGVISADFDRIGESLEVVVLSAIVDLERFPEFTVLRVEPDELVTMSGIAERMGRSRQSIAQLVAGDRGDGTFPVPLSMADGKTRIWRWTEVREWFAAKDGVELPDGERSHFLAALNAALDLRRHLGGYTEQGGNARIAAALRSLAFDDDSGGVDNSLSTATDEESSAFSLASLKSACADGLTGQTFKSVVHRAQSHVVFTGSWLMGDLVDSLEGEHPALAEHLQNAASAYQGSLASRLSGEFEVAALFDDVVMRNVMVILGELREPGRPRSAVAQRGYVPISMAPHRARRFHAGIGAIVKRGQPDPSDLGGLIDAIGTCHADHCAATTFAPLARPMNARSWWSPHDDLNSAAAAEVRYGSAWELYISSWVFATTFWALVHRHLPDGVDAANDMVARIAGDLSSGAFR
jgi:hypothetical protein